MPPANSPNREPPAPATSFASALRGLESAVDEDVLNLAATLTAQRDDMDGIDGDARTHARTHAHTDAHTDDDGDDDTRRLDEARASLRFLRTAQDRDQQRLEQSRARLRLLERTRDDDARDLRDPRDHRDRLRRSMDRLNRLHEASAAAHFPATAAQYGERVPSQNSLYDWSPLPPVALGPDDERSLRALQSRLNPTSNPPAAAPDSLRSTAILQAVRRHPRFSARTREYLQRFHHDRDGEGPRDARAAHPPPPPPAQPPPPAVAPMLEHTVRYLSRIRHANTVDESLNCALDAGFLSKDYFCIQYADFLTDTLSIPPPQPSSWLAPGAVLSGCQHATTSTSTSTAASTSTPHLAASHLPPPSRPWLSTSYSTPRSLTSYLSPNLPPRTEPSPPPPPLQDRWPVKVTIHAVDWSDMSLSATMEAYNVPSHPYQHSLSAPNPAQYTRTSSITTYLEGEILDYNTHTLLTESFKSSAATDALYWRKLPPFSDMDDEDVVRALTSRRWWVGLNRDWVLMRWKERCFVKSLRPSSKPSSQSPTPAPPVSAFAAPRDSTPDPNTTEYFVYDSHTFAPHPAPAAPDPPLVDAEHAAFDDSGCGLTISGFYFVCLRRCDGAVHGLYYDPMSSPYQCLQLESEGRGRFGEWAFA